MMKVRFPYLGPLSWSFIQIIIFIFFLPYNTHTVTPKDYQPPGFMATNSKDYIFDNTPVIINIGQIDTVNIN